MCLAALRVAWPLARAAATHGRRPATYRRSNALESGRAPSNAQSNAQRRKHGRLDRHRPRELAPPRPAPLPRRAGRETRGRDAPRPGLAPRELEGDGAERLGPRFWDGQGAADTALFSRGGKTDKRSDRVAAAFKGATSKGVVEALDQRRAAAAAVGRAVAEVGDAVRAAADAARDAAGGGDGDSSGK